MSKKLKDRCNIVALFFVFMSAVIIFQLINLQIINGEYYENISQRRLLRERDIVAPRGDILDRNGIPIAVNRTGFLVQLYKEKRTVDELNEVIDKVVKILEKNNDFCETSLSKYLTIEPFEYGTHINSSEQAIEKWKKEILVKKKDIIFLKTPEDVFNYLRYVKFKISPKYTTKEAYKIMAIRYETLIKGYSHFNPLVIARDVSKESVVEIEEKGLELLGVSIDVESYRKYNDATCMAHILGYVGSINREEYQRLKDDGYGINDILGKSGIEHMEEKNLRGKKGERKIEVDTRGKKTSEILKIPPIKGNDVILTIDYNLQKVAMESLERNIESIKKKKDNRRNFGDAYAGAVVAIDVNTGEVLTMASYPSYDPMIYLASLEDQEAKKKKMELLLDNENAPLLNRTIQGVYTPGSTFKPITAIAGLEEGVITKDTLIYDKGYTVLGGWKFRCLEHRMGLGAHGNLDLKRAIATSCNIYFHELGVKVGIDAIDKWSKKFGLGELTGIDVPGEVKGLRANRETKKKLRNDKWRVADTAQTAIGQFDNTFTPMQLANYIATIANGGKRFKPTIVKRIEDSDGNIIRENKSEFVDIGLKKETVDAIHEAMEAVANRGGTAARTFRNFKVKIAAKTGTPETGKEARHSSNAVFVCYAPVEKPEIALVVVIERGVWGANAAPVARDVLEEYFKSR